LGSTKARKHVTQGSEVREVVTQSSLWVTGGRTCRSGSVGGALLDMDAPALFNRGALDKLVLQLTSSRVSASSVRATRSLSDVRMQAEARHDSRPTRSSTPARRSRGDSSQRRPPRPREKRPKQTRPVATQQSIAAEAEASELTALLRCGNYSICVVRSDDLERSGLDKAWRTRSSSTLSSTLDVNRADTIRGAPRPVSAPARDRVPVAATRQSSFGSWHDHLDSRTAVRSSSRALRTISCSSAQSDGYDVPPPPSGDEIDSDGDLSVDSDSLFADDELTDVPHCLSAPELLSVSASSRWHHRGLDEAEEGLTRVSSKPHVSRSFLNSFTQPLSGPSSARRCSATSSHRGRSRKKSADARKARTIRRWVAADDQENIPPVARLNSSEVGLGRQTAAPPRPAGPPPVRSSSAIRSRAAAEVMLAMR
jgi:hypothetical protein